MPEVDAMPSPAGLRLAVARFRLENSRRTVRPTLHVGEPGGFEATFEDRPADRLDVDLRIEVAAALLSCALVTTNTPTAWLTREGELCTHDADLLWLAAVDLAGTGAGMRLAFLVITRRGWYDPRTLEQRVWKRLRITPG
jgi:hypothetical protein